MLWGKNNLLSYQAIFFDFDGVLVESTNIKTLAFRTLYKDFDDDVRDAVVAHHLAHEGISRYEKIRHCHKEFLGIRLSEDELGSLAERYSVLVKEAVVECESVPGALDFLESYSGKLPIFVVSGTPGQELREIIDRRGLGGFFTAVCGSPRHKAPIIESLLDEYGLDGPTCLFVGDAMTDYLAAAKTGLQFIGRVAEDHDNPFPEGTLIVGSLTEGCKIEQTG